MRSASAFVTAAMLTAALGLVMAPAAGAVDPCPNQPEKRMVAEGFGTLESIVVDRQGRVIFSETPGTAGPGHLLRIGRRGARPREIAAGIDAPGGLVLAPQGRGLIAGFGNRIPNGAVGNISPQAGLYGVDPLTGEKRLYAEGLMMANGVARGPGGVIYTSDDVGIGIDRIGPTGQVTNRWASVVSGNGLEVDRAGEWLYVATTFRPAAIDRVLISDPSRVEAFYRAPLGDISAGLDGMAIDGQDNLYVATVLAGEIWRVSNAGRACRLAEGIPMASDVAFGKTTRKGRFHRGNLYVTSFTGTVTELRGVRPRLKH